MDEAPYPQAHHPLCVIPLANHCNSFRLFVLLCYFCPLPVLSVLLADVSRFVVTGSCPMTGPRPFEARLAAKGLLLWHFIFGSDLAARSRTLLTVFATQQQQGKITASTLLKIGPLLIEPPAPLRCLHGGPQENSISYGIPCTFPIQGPDALCRTCAAALCSSIPASGLHPRAWGEPPPSTISILSGRLIYARPHKRTDSRQSRQYHQEIALTLRSLFASMSRKEARPAGLNRNSAPRRGLLVEQRGEAEHSRTERILTRRIWSWAL